MRDENPLTRVTGPLVQWEYIGGAQFDRLIEALVPYQHPLGTDVRPVDGRGGDGGIDIDVVEPGGRHVIYQLKYFPEGFDGKAHNHRRAGQIEPSLVSALQHDPDEWVLVAPCKPTQQGYAYLDRLRKKYPDVKLTFIGSSQLDTLQWCAGHHGVVTSLLHRPTLLSEAAIMRQEEAVLTDPARDLASRMAKLAQQVDRVDPFYTLAFSHHGDVSKFEVLPRHSSAQQLSPIQISPTFADPNSPEAIAWEHAHAYGVVQPVVVSAAQITEIVVTGTSLIPLGLEELRTLELHPQQVETEHTPLRLLLNDSQGQRIAAHTGTVLQTAPGSRGVTIRQVFYELLQITWSFPFTHGGTPTMNFSFAAANGTDVGQIMQAARMALQLRDATQMVLNVCTGDRQEVASIVATEPINFEADFCEYLPVIEELAADLLYVQGATNTVFPMPLEISALDRVWLRVIRRMYEGRPTRNPQTSSFAFEAKPAFLSFEQADLILSGQPWPCVAGSDEPSIVDIAGEGLEIAPFSMAFLPARFVGDAHAARQALQAGRNYDLQFRCEEGHSAVMYMPDRMMPEALVVPEPWGLIGIHEPES